MHENEIYFDRPDEQTWLLAQLHCSIRHSIEKSPLWEREEIPDIPLTEEQMLFLARGYRPDWDCPYAQYLLGGWFYITRSGYWLKKFRYKKRKDGLYHITEHYTTPKLKGFNVLRDELCIGR